MKTILILFTVLLIGLAVGCKEDPASSAGESISIDVKYYHPDDTYANGYEYFSPVASITWNGGNTTIANSNQTIKISVPKGATLTATYSRTFKSYSGSAYDKNDNYKKTLVADAYKHWNI